MKASDTLESDEILRVVGEYVMSTTVKRIAIFAFSCLTVFAADNLPDLQGVHNFHQVNDHLYRGAQPTDPGFAQLAKLGVKTIVDLRESGDRSASEKKTVEAAGMHYLSFPMAGYSVPSVDVMTKLLALFEDAKSGPVFVHCRRGADRTGTVLAVYRMVHDHWENAKALAEAKAFGMSWTERAMQSYITHYKVAEPAAVAAVSQQQ
jgi:tyrosine-protein phosphatase SIW14